MSREVYVSLPAMFMDSNGIEGKDLVLRLKKSLYGLREAPKLWADFLAKGLYKAGFKPSDHDPGIYYGRGLVLAVYGDDVLLFGPNADEMDKVLEELQLAGLELKTEKDTNDNSYDFLGIHVTQPKIKKEMR